MTGKVLQILEIQDNGFNVNKETFFSVLDKVGNRPFEVLSINGATRTGKSYVLNYIIRYYENEAKGCTKESSWFNSVLTNSFNSNSGRNPVTVGVSLWSEPYIIKQKNGREIAVLLMDCQGLFDKKTKPRENAIIFSFSTLCSSLSIFNLMKNINENDLQIFEFYSGYAYSAFGEDENSRSKNLRFLIRDVDFPDYEFGYHDSITKPGNSKQNFFIDTFSGSELTNNATRNKIMKAHNNVGTFLLPYPGSDFVRNKSYTVEDEFKKYLIEFVKFITSDNEIKTKTVCGNEITGIEFKKFVEGWAKLCDQADFPPVGTIAEVNANIHNTNVETNAHQFFVKHFYIFMENNPDGVDEKMIQQVYEEILSKAMDYLHRMRLMGGVETREGVVEKLNKGFQLILQNYRSLNRVLLEKAEKLRNMNANEQNGKLELSRMRNQIVALSEEKDEAKRNLASQIQQFEKKLETFVQEEHERRERFREARERDREERERRERDREEREKRERDREERERRERDREERERRERENQGGLIVITLPLPPLPSPWDLLKKGGNGGGCF